MSNYIKIEYVWIDGYENEQNLRSKTKVIQDPYSEFIGDEIDLTHLKEWSFDGSSTKQAKGSNSDCILIPVRLLKDPMRSNAYVALCEVLDANGAAHDTNQRSQIKTNNEDSWFGFEQEYFLMRDGKPLGWPSKGYPKPQGQYYCAIGSKNVSGRKIVEEHLDVCIKAGLNVSGVNAEVALGQWEYQLFGKGAMTASDDLWLSRYFLYKVCEKHEVEVSLHPKPIKGQWNGSGMHVNFSNGKMREEGGKEMLKDMCDTLASNHLRFIAEYGFENDQRLTGEYETAPIDKFSYGVSDRGASIRIPVGVANNNWKGYLEDRRPASNADPYRITRLLSTTVL
jgi:glutamine synthetase